MFKNRKKGIEIFLELLDEKYKLQSSAEFYAQSFGLLVFRSLILADEVPKHTYLK